MKKQRLAIFWSIVGLAMICLLIALVYRSKHMYTPFYLTNDSAESYKDENGNTCNAANKRPIVKLNTVTGFYISSFLGSGTRTTNESELKKWKLQQGDCPYQIRDIYESGEAYDLNILAVVFITGAIYVLKPKKLLKNNKIQH